MTTVKLKDVAAAAGVSQGTASNVFNRPDTVTPKLRERVLAAAEALNYRGPAPAGRALRSGKTHLIALVTESTLGYLFADPYSRRLLTGLGNACDKAGAGVAVVSTETGHAQGWSIETAVADGFVLFCVEDGTRLIGLARRRALPFVAVDSGKVEGVATVDIDDRAAAASAAAHLTGLGHRRFGVLSLELAGDGKSGPIDEAREAQARYSVARERLRGYRQELERAGVAWGEVLKRETFNDRATTAAAIGAMFGDPSPPTALLAMSDTLALFALDELRKLGLRVPEDVSVVGFDDGSRAERSEPPLTTVRQPVEAKGWLAGRMLLGEAEARARVLPTELVVRASTGAPK